MVKKRLFFGGGALLVFLMELLIAGYPENFFVRPYLGDVLVVILIYLLICTFMGKGIKHLEGYVFLFACMVEFTQFLHLADHLGLKKGDPLRIILGSSFDWKDILCYAAGCLAIAGANAVKSKGDAENKGRGK